MPAEESNNKALCPPEKIDLLFWFYRFSQGPKLELQEATAVDTKIEQFYFRTSSKINSLVEITFHWELNTPIEILVPLES